MTSVATAIAIQARTILELNMNREKEAAALEQLLHVRLFSRLADDTFT